MSFTPAEQLLRKLGVTEPTEIDLEAVAYHVGARVQYRPLYGCEARIIGNGDKAIITVNNAGSLPRKRFSIAHELGHWHHHRGQSLVCRADEYRPDRGQTPERLADGYAADLLMPNYLFRPLARQQSKLTFKAVATIADTFNTSRTATAIRLVESDLFPALLVCHGMERRKWFIRPSSVPEHWFPDDTLSADSSAFEILFGRRTEDSTPRKIAATAWFTCREARGHDIFEQTIRTGDGEIVTLLTFGDPHMLEENSSYGRFR